MKRNCCSAWAIHSLCHWNQHRSKRHLPAMHSMLANLMLYLDMLDGDQLDEKLEQMYIVDVLSLQLYLRLYLVLPPQNMEC